MKAEMQNSIRRTHSGRSALTFALTAFLTFFCIAAQKSAPSPMNHYFRAFDVYVDSKDQALAAYQVDLSFSDAKAKIVGIEGGEPAVFKEPPIYDPKAIQHERVIIAAFNTVPADKLPKGRTRVATLHVQITGEASQRCEVHSTTAATADGKKIAIATSVEERKSK